MADRSVVVRLRAEIGQYQAAMAKAKDVTTEFGREVTGKGKSAKADIEAVGRASIVASGVMAVGFAKTIGIAADFEKEMSGVRAVSGATAAQMEQLSDAALAAGASQKLAGVTASDAARAEGELVKAGVSVSDILGGGLMGSLTLASAGQLDFAKAAEIAAQAMNIFELRGDQVTHIADVLAAAANKSAADVGQLGDALRQGGLVAAQTGLSLEESVGALAAFADNALVGSDAGTSLKTMLQRLTPQSKEAAELMEELGFSAYDAQGNFIGLEGLARELETSLGGMTVEQRNAAMATLFGSDAVRAANILYAQGAEGIQGYVDAVNDQGAAARMAAIQNDNLKGDLEALGGAIESALIENGSQANGILRTLTQTATNAVGGFSSLPEPVQATAFGLGAVATAGLGVLGVIGTLGPKLEKAKESLEKMGTLGTGLSNNLGKIASGMTVLGAGVAVWAAWETAMASARNEAQGWAADWRALAFDTSEFGTGLDAFKANARAVTDEMLRMDSDLAGSMNPFDADYREQLRAGIGELENIGGEMDRIIALSEDLADQFGITGDAALEFVLSQQAAGVDVLAENYDAVAESLGKTFTGMQGGTVASQTLAEGMGTLGSEITSVEDRVKAFDESLDALFNTMFGVESAQDALQSGLNELPDVLNAASEEGLNLNEVLTGQSDQAITVREHMRGMVQDASDLIAEWHEQGVTGDELAMKVALLSEGFRKQAEAAGLPAPVVDHYLGLLAQIPPTKATTVNANTADAESKLERLARLIREAAPADIALAARFSGKVAGSTGGLVPSGLQPLYRAGGGPVGTDTVPAWLTPGEYVMRRSAVDRFGVGFMDAVNAGRIASPNGGGTTLVMQITNHGTATSADSQALVDGLTAWVRDNGKPLPALITGVG